MNTLKANSLWELDSILRDNVYMNATADPTHTKYLYDDVLRKLDGFRQFVVNPWACTVLAYDRKYYNRIDLLSVFTGNSGLSFEYSPGKIFLGELLDIDEAMGDPTSFGDG